MIGLTSVYKIRRDMRRNITPQPQGNDQHEGVTLEPSETMIGTVPLPLFIAQVAHEANRAYCQALGDTSQPAWGDAPEWQTQSAINGVNFRLLNPDCSPSTLHEAWLQEKVEAGWVYGDVKDVDAKTHPCCLPYEELPYEQRVKDILFASIVKATYEAVTN